MYIDTHVHLRDFNQTYKETIKHGLEVAYDSGVDAVFDMPNTDPPIMTRELVEARIKLAKDADVPVFYGIHMGLTAKPEQIRRAADVYRAFPQVIGMKLYAGHSTGDLGVVTRCDQRVVYETLSSEGYDGVLMVHCEKESAMNRKLWIPSRPTTHCHARPERAEVESVHDQIKLARESGFTGKLHIAHISSPDAVYAVDVAKAMGLDISCGVCPHHLIYDLSQMFREDGVLWKMNPPLRKISSRDKLLQCLKDGKINWIETDHAPHALAEKTGKVSDANGKPSYASGIPGLAWWPLFDEYLRKQNFSDSQIEALTFNNALDRFGLDIKRTRRPLKDRRVDYPFDPYASMAAELGF